jgi:hypothetical protein
MAVDETQILREELEHYRAEKERIRQIIGQIGGKPSLKRALIFNIAIVSTVVVLFVLDLLREAFGLWAGVIPPFVLLEIAIFVMSLKIVWMIHLQMELHHFQFWILNSLDFQVNELSRRMRTLEQRAEPLEAARARRAAKGRSRPA